MRLTISASLAGLMLAGCSTYGGENYGRYDWNRPDPAYGG